MNRANRALTDGYAQQALSSDQPSALHRRKEVPIERGCDDREPQRKDDSTVVHFENCVSISGHSVLIPSFEKGGNRAADVASKVLFRWVGLMNTRTGFFQLVSAVVGLSVGVGVMTATVLLGVAALLQ